ncbi:site-specific integrase [Azoarcus sp. KH32C]|uniref:tyrosine-type recombinase/integrase n=1 Tax=Azoarcus sp. KH32C TaxID=748247 RepID=UPI00023865D6|nr:site-specific integrase [Azoarcus sp. KH32C]BAL23656.1 hypothetical protein AZKH_1334 [Azoarcus sp. KH32C]
MDTTPVALLSALADQHKLAEADRCRRALTDRQVKSEKPGAKERKVADGGGLTLCIQPTGHRVWRHRFNLGGKPQTYTIGPYPEVSLALARTMSRAAAWIVERGEHPKAYLERQREEAEAAAAKAMTVRQCCEKWRAETDGNIAATSAENRRSMLEKYVLATLGERPIASVRRKELVELLAGVDAKVPVTAQHCQRHLKMLFEWAVNREYAPGNPTPGAGRDVLPRRRGRKVVPRKAMARADVPGMLAELDAAAETHALTKIAMKLLILTWCRTAEIVGARWDEVNFDTGDWTIPAWRMKNRIKHTVGLSRQAVALLREAEKHRVEHNAEYVFPGRRGRGHMSRTTLHQWLVRYGYSDDADVHGFRATARTWCSAGRVADEVVAEYALAHQPKDPTKAAYDREKYVDDIRALLQKWADEVDRLVAAHRAAATQLPADPAA